MTLPEDRLCDVESMMRMSGLALIAFVRLSLQILAVGVSLPRRILATLSVYCAGLIALEKKQTALRITRSLGGLNHDSLTRMLSTAQWNCSALLRHFLTIIQLVLGHGYLVIDDTLIPHPRSKKMEGVYWDFDHAENRNVYGQRLVVLLWSNGFWRIPLGFSFWHKQGARAKYRTKNEIAATLLKWAIHHGVNADYVTFDNWYASKENMKLIVNDLGLGFVTRLKRNCRLLYEGKKLQARTIGRRVLQAARSYKQRGLGVWARVAEVQVADMGRMSFVVVKDDLDGERSTIKYLLASTPRSSAREVILRYRSRWIIETFFQDLKQYLGLCSHQGLKLCASERHVAAACLALVVLDHARLVSGCSLAETKSILQRLIFVSTRSGQMQLATLEPVPAERMDRLDEAKDVVDRQLESVTGLVLRKYQRLASL